MNTGPWFESIQKWLSNVKTCRNVETTTSWTDRSIFVVFARFVRFEAPRWRQQQNYSIGRKKKNNQERETLKRMRVLKLVLPLSCLDSNITDGERTLGSLLTFNSFFAASVILLFHFFSKKNNPTKVNLDPGSLWSECLLMQWTAQVEHFVQIVRIWKSFTVSRRIVDVTKMTCLELLYRIKHLMY